MACIAKADSGATTHFWKETDQHVLGGIQVENGPLVTLPNATNVNDKKVGFIPFPDRISNSAKKARICKDLNSTNLISLGQLADDGCETYINDKYLDISKKGKVLLTGKRNFRDGLYDIPIFYDHPNPKTFIQEQNFVLPTIHNIQSVRTFSPNQRSPPIRIKKSPVRHKTP